jgi:radical SAM superfamily enzyme YgiQ (UPF0313 family)
MIPLLLVNAPYPRKLKFYGQPTSLLYAAAHVVPWLEKEEGRGSVRLINYNLFPPEWFLASGEQHFYDLLSTLEPRVVAISSTTAALNSARRLARAAKRMSRPPVVVFGGPHEDDAPEPTATWDTNVDLSVVGDGESALRLIVDCVLNHPDKHGEKLAQEIARFGPQPYIEGTSKILCKTNGVSGIKPLETFRTTILHDRNKDKVNLDKLPFAPRHLLEPLEKYHYPIFRNTDGTVKASTQLMTQRGCVAKCHFCSESQQLFQRSASSVKAELESLSADGYEAIFFDDSTFTNHTQHRRTFLKEIGRTTSKLGFECGCQTRVDMVDKEILRSLADSGFTYIYFGVESMVPMLLDALGKHYKVDKIKEALEAARDVGLRVGASLLLGAPDDENNTLETLETAESTFRQIREYVDNGPIELVSLNVFEYYPGTTSTVARAKSDPTITDYRTESKFAFPDEYPFDLLEENPVHCPNGLQKIARPILLKAAEILGDVLVNPDKDMRQASLVNNEMIVTG